MSTAQPAGDPRDPRRPPPVSGGTRREVSAVLPAAPHGPTLSWWGAIMAVTAFGMVLSAILFAYAFLSAQAQGWPPAGVERPGLLLPTIGTGLLLASIAPSLAVHRFGTTGRGGPLQGACAAAALLGAGHLVLQVLTYSDLPMRPQEGAYGSVFLLMLLLHHTALLSGVVGFAILLVQTWDEPGERLMGGARGLNLWWCGLVAMWLLVYATLYLSPLVFGQGS
jgi:cytochrome c oxidase subunit III